jgi:hypothetical protein
VVALVREYWERTKDVARRSSLDAMKQAIRQKLGISSEQAPVQPPPAATIQTPTSSRMVRMVMKNIFRVRIEERGSIIYRKHWVVLAQQIGLPSLIGLGLLAGLFHNLVIARPESLNLAGVLFALFVASFLWWLYQVMDWSNDIFQVTSDQILDIDKTPFGRMQKNVAPLDNILSTEARREGLLQNLLNYGNVYISVGGSQMVFENVMDPASVQQDIDHRRVARRSKLEVERVTAERERMAEFFALYHASAEEFRRELESNPPQTPPSDPPMDPS